MEEQTRSNPRLQQFDTCVTRQTKTDIRIFT